MSKEQYSRITIPARLARVDSLIDKASFEWQVSDNPNYSNPSLQEFLLEIGKHQNLRVFLHHTGQVDILRQAIVREYADTDEMEDLNPSDYLTAVSGRKRYTRHNAHVPLRKIQNGIISTKGLGPTFTYVDSTLFKNDRPYGFTHLGIEAEVEKLVTSQRFRFADIYGETSERSLVLNRYMLATVNIEHVLEYTGNILALSDLDSIDYPGIDTDNPLVAVFHENYLDFTLQDMLYHLRASIRYNENEKAIGSYDLIRFLGTDTRAVFVHYLKEAYKQLFFQPLFESIYAENSPTQLTETYLINYFFPRLIAGFSQSIHDTAYILSRIHVSDNQVFSPSPFWDNQSFAGIQDLADVEYRDIPFVEGAEQIIDLAEPIVFSSSFFMQELMSIILPLLNEKERRNIEFYFQSMWPSLDHLPTQEKAYTTHVRTVIKKRLHKFFNL